MHMFLIAAVTTASMSTESEEFVPRLLQELVVAEPCGPEGLSTGGLHECAEELTTPLCKLAHMFFVLTIAFYCTSYSTCTVLIP